jgi:hypothetical protein
MHERIKDGVAALAAAAAAATCGAAGRAHAADNAAAAAAGLVRVRGHWLQTCSASGRITSQLPSLQTANKDIQFTIQAEGAAGQVDAAYVDSDADDSDEEQDCEGNAAAAAAGGRSARSSATTAVAAVTAAAQAMQADQQQQQQQQQQQPEAGLMYTASVRAGFVASPGCVILGADYCQIEFRLMVHFSGDAALLHAFSCGQDPFKTLAGSWLKKPSQHVRAGVV